jgi:hypothetical protein
VAHSASAAQVDPIKISDSTARCRSKGFRATATIERLLHKVTARNAVCTFCRPFDGVKSTRSTNLAAETWTSPGGNSSQITPKYLPMLTFRTLPDHFPSPISNIIHVLSGSPSTIDLSRRPFSIIKLITLPLRDPLDQSLTPHPSPRIPHPSPLTRAPGTRHPAPPQPTPGTRHRRTPARRSEVPVPAPRERHSTKKEDGPPLALTALPHPRSPRLPHQPGWPSWPPRMGNPPRTLPVNYHHQVQPESAMRRADPWPASGEASSSPKAISRRL